MSRVLAVGDIHTKTWIIDRVEKIADGYDRIVFVGDYADDWGKQPIDTINTWKRLKDFQENNPEKVNLVIGNHDYVYISRTSTESSGYSIGTQFLLNLPANYELKEWLKNIPIKVELDGITYSHAGFNIPYGWEYKDNQVFGHTPSQTCWEVPSGKNVWCIDTFSTHRDGTPFGDKTVLEITDGKTFTKIKLEE